MNTSMKFVLYIFGIVSCVAATPYTEHKNNINNHDEGIYARDFSFVSDVPDDAYDNDNKVTVAIAASIGGVAGLVFLSSLVYAFIRRKKLRNSEKHQQLNNRDIEHEIDVEIDTNHGNDDISGFEMSRVTLPQHTQENIQYPNPDPYQPAYKPAENNFEPPRHNSIAMPSPFAIDMPRYSAMNTPIPSEFNTPAHSAYNSLRHVAFNTGNDTYSTPRQLALMNRHNAANITGQSAPVTPRQSAPVTPRQSAPPTPRQSAPVTPRQSAPTTPRYVP
ncbi:hypothetical protein COEREDRAFT_99646 [Coemansia reversa NRRL 1564]|uniref:Mid2 domain-containing protein n=1 Tax=Coemansia reversa (strain ATCC 12441 / NRRL 1564) TaxID=763665 RepID=A0A2G5B2S7_COERN|nr:hypothetical protein COEREDRAFT_99646 [Coemansia reversa NRRL 1564]|eukprot:PIA13320.1 hypothetical protein COEREDRAFT_99646 [Coemansia reversa NRRL 1564]